MTHILYPSFGRVIIVAVCCGAANLYMNTRQDDDNNNNNNVHALSHDPFVWGLILHSYSRRQDVFPAYMYLYRVETISTLSFLGGGAGGWLGAVSEGAREIPTSKAIRNSYTLPIIYYEYIHLCSIFREI